jgi:hypothetical protein
MERIVRRSSGGKILLAKLLAPFLFLAAVPLTLSAASPTLTIELKDYATIPMTGQVDGRGNPSSLARIETLQQEPGKDRGRFFVNDINGPLYILDTKTKKTLTYLDFNGNGDKPGLFHKLFTRSGNSDGLIMFAFDPDYAHNGKFYTVHIEDPTLPGSPMPDNSHFPGLNLTGYSVTTPIQTPGPTKPEAVLIEWTDTNTANSTFEGTARELMRLELTGPSHPMSGLIFDPAAKPGSPDWRVLYITVGDGAAGESMNLAIRQNPQRLDDLVGKVLRIIPDLDEHTDSSTVSENGRYRIPNDNPFVSVPGARKEIWAYGLRNPERMDWYHDPADPSKDGLIATVVGLHTWETVDIIHKGTNYGYSLREGNQQLDTDDRTSPVPDPDKIPIRVDATNTIGMVTPSYPVVEYAHDQNGGDAISNGYVYQGKNSALRGKFIFGDITTGHIWYVNYDEMLAADKSNGPKSLAEMHPVQIVWDKPEGGKEQYSSMYPICEAAYHARGGKAQVLPGRAPVSGNRADIHFSEDTKGNLYIISKSDGMIREVVGATLQ